MTINKPIKIIGPSGVYGGISVLGAGSAITTVNAVLAALEGYGLLKES